LIPDRDKDFFLRQRIKIGPESLLPFSPKNDVSFFPRVKQPEREAESI
jgi:hypothetical protein